MIFNWGVDTAIGFGGAGWAKKGRVWGEGWSCKGGKRMLCSTSCYTYSTSWDGGWGESSHNGSVSCPMRPVQWQTDGQNRQMANLQDKIKKRPDWPTVQHISTTRDDWMVNSDKVSMTKASATQQTEMGAIQWLFNLRLNVCNQERRNCVIIL